VVLFASEEIGRQEMRVWIFFVFVFLMGNVLAIDGVSPGSYEVDFEAGLEKEFVFDFVLDGERELEVRGNLAEYVELDKEKIFGNEKVVAKLKLPDEMVNFGVESIWISVGSVAGIIKVRTPYPERYVGLDLAIPNANAGEEVPINLKVLNLGKAGFNVSPIVEIYFDDEVVSVFEGEKRFVWISEEGEYWFVLNSSNYSAGEYLAVAKVDYEGESFEGRDSFRLGELGVNIVDWTREVRGGGVEKFEVEVESLYDDAIGEIHFEVRAPGGDVEGFDSSIVGLGRWEKKTLVGYFNTRGLEGNVSLNVNVYSDGEVESVSIVVYVEKRISLIFWIAGGLLLLGAVGWIFLRKSK
jgi:hypothetical protein